MEPLRWPVAASSWLLPIPRSRVLCRLRYNPRHRSRASRGRACALRRAASPLSRQRPRPSQPEQKAVGTRSTAFAKVFGIRGRQGALPIIFTDEVVVTDPEGSETRGKAAVAEMYAGSFQENPGLKLESEVAEVRFITPDVARVEGQSRLSSAKGDAREFTRFSSLWFARTASGKRPRSGSSLPPAEDVAPYERLQELEWMVGHWVDDSGNNKVEADVRWADNNSYLIRTYNAQVQGEKPTSGTMFIGWDPQSGQIKSWNFDSEGGHGEGLWTRTNENEWVVKAQGVLRDGRPTSATQIHTILNKDSVKTNSVDRIIGGQIAPDIIDVVMVRKPPQPGVAAPNPAAAATAPK